MTQGKYTIVLLEDLSDKFDRMMEIVLSNTRQLENTATKDDIARLEGKIEIIKRLVLLE